MSWFRELQAPGARTLNETINLNKGGNVKINQNKRLLRDIKANAEHWFDRGNKQFFNDISYSAYYSGKTGERYFLQLTKKWASDNDRFYRLYNVDDNFKIGELVQEFNSLADVKNWLRNN